MFERANVAADHQQLLMVTLEEAGAEARHGVPVPREAVRRHQRLRQARQLLPRQRHRGQPAAARRHPARQRAVPRLLRCGHPRRAQVRRPAAGLGRLGDQRPPARRQRGPAGDHLDLPRRPADGRLRPDRQGRRHLVQGEGHPAHRRRHPAGPADRPGRPQPYQPVRLHRQPVRVPCPGLAAVGGRPDGHDQHDPGRGAGVHRRRARLVRRRRHGVQRLRAEGARGHHHRPRQLRSSTATATPRSGRSRRPRAGCPTSRPRWTRCPS